MVSLPYDIDLFKQLVEISNVTEFASQLPLKYNIRIGSGGIGISGGQRQRIFITRAIYKNPQYPFFDEAKILTCRIFISPGYKIPNHSS